MAYLRQEVVDRISMALDYGPADAAGGNTRPFREFDPASLVSGNRIRAGARTALQGHPMLWRTDDHSSLALHRSLRPRARKIDQGLFVFSVWIGRPNAGPPKHNAGTDQPETLPPS
jgi:hypothetical protein